MLEELQAESDRGKAFEVLEENWPVIDIFCAVQTQWRVGGMGGIVGLNYQSVELMFKIYETPDKRDVFECLQIMELEILRLQAEKRK